MIRRLILAAMTCSTIHWAGTGEDCSCVVNDRYCSKQTPRPKDHSSVCNPSGLTGRAKIRIAYLVVYPYRRSDNPSIIRSDRHMQQHSVSGSMPIMLSPTKALCPDCTGIEPRNSSISSSEGFFVPLPQAGWHWTHAGDHLHGRFKVAIASSVGASSTTLWTWKNENRGIYQIPQRNS